MDAQLAGLTDALAAGFAARGRRRARLRAAIALALEFTTWQRLTRDGLDDAAAAQLMADLAATAAG
jgi:hypothetical protein